MFQMSTLHLSRRPKDMHVDAADQCTTFSSHTPSFHILLRISQKMSSARRSDAQQTETQGNGDSSPEMFLSGHQSRLAMPRDWRSTLSRRKSENSGGGANGSGKKELRQAQLEMDGEWYADARDAAASKAEKVCSNTITMHAVHLLVNVRMQVMQEVPHSRMCLF